MIKDGKGGANTKTGLIFEGKTELATTINNIEEYEVKNDVVYYNGEEIAYLYKKHALYRYLKEEGIDWNKYISKKLLPDNSVYIKESNKLFIIEYKYQNSKGSVDEKIQTCDFKRKEYQKLMKPLGVDVEFIYVLCDWFRDPKYKDALEYIESVGCFYYFNNIPLSKIGLPTSFEEK